MSATAAALWRQSRDLADACLEHPFVQGIASGDLAPERFRVYVAQDACYLEAFARAYALAGLPEKVDLAVVSIPAEGALAAITDLVEADRAASIILIPGGFAEAGATDLAARIEGTHHRGGAGAPTARATTGEEKKSVRTWFWPLRVQRLKLQLYP